MCGGAFLIVSFVAPAALVARPADRRLQGERRYHQDAAPTFAEHHRTLGRRLAELPPDRRRRAAADWKPVVDTFRAGGRPTRDEAAAAFTQVRRNLGRRAAEEARQAGALTPQTRRATSEQLRALNALMRAYEDERVTLTPRLPEFAGSAPAKAVPDAVDALRAERFEWLRAETDYLHELGAMDGGRRRQARRAFREANAEALDDLAKRFVEVGREQARRRIRDDASAPESPEARFLRRRARERADLLRGLAGAPEFERREALDAFHQATREALGESRQTD